VSLANRTHSKALRAAQDLKCRAVLLDDLPSLLDEVDIVVSALLSPINLIRKEWLRPSHILLDANYPRSPLQALAQARASTYIPGEAWLLNQALPAYKLFTGKEAERTIMAHALVSDVRSTASRNNISLVGFMGCGKSTVGRTLAKKLGYSFKDIDAVIERQEGKTIPEIFRLKGEQVFRSLEKSALSEIQQDRRTVYACGGGAVSDPDNRNTLRSNSCVIWLHAALESCLKRIDPHSRPLLDKEGRGEKPEDLFRKRLPFYAQAAELVVSSEKTPEETVGNIYEEIYHTLGD
jgi:shikimate kinase